MDDIDLDAESGLPADVADEEAEQNRRDDARAGLRMVLATIVYSFFLFLGKFSGFIRNMLMSYWFGGDARTDAFNKINDVLIYGMYTNFEKVLRPAYLPQFVRERRAGGDEQAWPVTSVVANLELGLLLVSCVLFEILAPLIIRLAWRNLAADPLAYGVAVVLLRMMAPTLIFLGMSLMPELTLHAYKRFTLAAAAEFVYRIGMVAGLVAGVFILVAPQQVRPIQAAALGVIIGGSLRFFAMLPGLWQRLRYYRPLLNPARVPGAMTVLNLVPPLLVGMLAAAARNWADTIYTDQIGAGAYTFLKYGRQMSDAPLQILPLAVSLVVYPFLSEWAARGERDKLAEALVSMTRIMAFIFVPITVASMFMARPTIGIMFEHGELKAGGADLSAVALFCYLPGLLFFTLEGSINKWFFALQDTKTPNYWGAAMAVLNIVFSYIAVFVLYRNGMLNLAGAIAAVALGYTLSKSAKVVILYGLIRRQIGRIDGRAALAFALKLAVASAVMSAATYLILGALQPPLSLWQPGFVHSPSMVMKVKNLALWAAVGTGGGAAFLVAAALVRIEELAMITGFVKEKLGKRLRR